MDTDDRLRLDYQGTTDLLKLLVDIRFKLLATVPTISGIAVGLLGRPRSAAELLGVGLLGLVATLGIFIYELRNTQIYDAALRRAGALEKLLGFPSTIERDLQGGLFSERPEPANRLLSGVTIVHNRGLALVYGAALAGWSYLVAWGTLRALEVGEARKIGAAVGALVGLVVLAEVERLDRRADAKAVSPVTEEAQASPAG